MGEGGFTASHQILLKRNDFVNFYRDVSTDLFKNLEKAGCCFASCFINYCGRYDILDSGCSYKK